jgi:hypothetical protein
MTKQLAVGHLGLPPPTHWNLYDADRAIGWTTEKTVGFLGFGDQTEAVHAAWVAYRALAGRLAREEGRRVVPIDTESLSVWRHGDRELILASGRAIARLVRPGERSRSGSDTFGFEVDLPHPVDELRVRAMAHLMYRTLRKSGIRWALWRPSATDFVPSALNERRVRVSPVPNGVAEPIARVGDQSRRRGRQPGLPPRQPVPAPTWAAVALTSLTLLLIALVVPQRLGIALAVTGLAALAILCVVAMPRRRVGRSLTGDTP